MITVFLREQKNQGGASEAHPQCEAIEDRQREGEYASLVRDGEILRDPFARGRQTLDGGGRLFGRELDLVELIESDVDERSEEALLCYLFILYDDVDAETALKAAVSAQAQAETTVPL